jgi:RNA polymerase sigma factor (sigma-70 family)
LTDEELISQIARGNRQAFNDLYVRYRPKVFSTAFHYLQHTHDAEELTQDVFVELFRSAGKYNAKATPGTWIFRITVNKCLDKLRYRKAKKRFAFISYFFQSDEHGDVPDAEGRQPFSDDENTMLHKAIDRLPEKQKTALILTQIEELSIKETAAIMDTTPKAVESLTHRAKANLKNLLKK